MSHPRVLQQVSNRFLDDTIAGDAYSADEGITCDCHVVKKYRLLSLVELCVEQRLRINAARSTAFSG
jgi:hypothetical protein